MKLNPRVFSAFLTVILLMLVTSGSGCRSLMSTSGIWAEDERLFRNDLDTRYPLGTLKSEILHKPRTEIDIWENVLRPGADWWIQKDDHHGVAKTVRFFEQQSGKKVTSCLMINVSVKVKRRGGSFDYLFFDSEGVLIGSHRHWAEWML